MSNLVIQESKPLIPVKSDLNILMSSSPKHLKVTQAMVEDFIWNPVLGAEVLLNEKLDEYQKARLKLCWHVPRVMDSSGFSSAKTKNVWILSVLRCLLMSDHVGGVYYQVFSTGQKTYWPYFAEANRRSRIFRAQIGVVKMEKGDQEGKATMKGPSCWTCSFKNNSQIMMPAPGFLQDAKTQASIRLNDLWIDEWTKIEATGSEGIDEQLIGRATRHCFNQDHPLWCNHQMFLATAEDTMHPAYERYLSYLTEVKRGNPDYALLSYSQKDLSSRIYRDGVTFKQKFREKRVLIDMKKNRTRAGYLQEVLGIWSKNGKGLYTQDIIDKCYEIGAERKSTPIIAANNEVEKDSAVLKNVFYFLGIDPSKGDNNKADDGALVALRASARVPEPTSEERDWRVEPCYAYKVRKCDAAQWAAIIHRKHQHFNFTRMMMDPGGGGVWIRPELAKPKQMIRDRETKVRPIGCYEDEGTMMVNAAFILSMFKISDHRISQVWGDISMKTSDNLNDAAHTCLLEGMVSGILGFPQKFRERTESDVSDWPDERRNAALLIDMSIRQLQAIAVATEQDGKTAYTKNNARIFSAKGKKDFAYALMYAYTAFLAWLKSIDSNFEVDDENSDMAG
jgi:hypothetical protein